RNPLYQRSSSKPGTFPCRPFARARCRKCPRNPARRRGQLRFGGATSFVRPEVAESVQEPFPACTAVCTEVQDRCSSSLGVGRRGSPCLAQRRCGQSELSQRC